MRAMMFDTLALAQFAKAASFPPDQAADLAKAINTSAVETIASKQDLGIQARPGNSSKTWEFKQDIAELKSDMVRWIAGALMAQTAVTVGLIVALGNSSITRG